MERRSASRRAALAGALAVIVALAIVFAWIGSRRSGEGELVSAPATREATADHHGDDTAGDLGAQPSTARDLAAPAEPSERESNPGSEPAGFEISGSVLHLDGRAVGGAEVLLLRDSESALDDAVASSRSGPDGRYRIRLNPYAAWIVARDAKDRFSWTMPISTWTSRMEMDLVLRGLCEQLAVRVEDAQGRGIPQAEVLIDNEYELQRRSSSGDIAFAKGEDRRGQTRADGIATFENVQAGQLELLVCARGYASRFLFPEIVDGERQELTARLEASGIVRGTVRWDSGAPAVSVYVYAHAADCSLAAKAETAADGSFVLEDLEQGTYGLEATNGLYARTRLPGVSLRRGETFEWSPVLPENAETRRVEWKKWRGRLRDAGGTPLAGWRIGTSFLGHDEFGGSSITGESARSDAEGRFEVPYQGELADILVFLDGPEGSNESRVLEHVWDEMEVVISAADLAAVRGTILGNAPTEARPWTVRIHGRNVADSSWKLDRAEFFLERLALGDRVFTFCDAQDRPVAALTARLEAGKTFELGTIPERTPGRIAVVVEDDEFRRWRSALWIALEGVDYLPCEFDRDASGAYVSELLSPGNYEVYLRMEHRADWRGDVTVSEGETAYLRADPAKGIRTRLRMEGLSAKQSMDPRVEVAVLDRDGQEQCRMVLMFSGYSFVLAPGRYEIRATQGDRLLGSQWVEVDATSGEGEAEIVVEVR